MASIVEQSTERPNAKRTTYGIDIQIGTISLNEWGLHESLAKQVDELLKLSNNEPIVLEGITFTRRKPSELAQKLAALKASMAPKTTDTSTVKV